MSTTHSNAVLSAAPSGIFSVSGAGASQRGIVRLGFGTMQLTGKGVWGAPRDGTEARRVLGRARDLGIMLIDTADSYGPDVSENLVRDVLYPYDGLLIATKGGLTRPGPNVWVPNGRPEYLREAVLGSLKRLGLEAIPLWQLHRIDSKIPREDQFGVIAEMRAEGLIQHVGLSEATVEDIRAAEVFFKVATVQNHYNLAHRANDDVVAYCEQNHIGFIPWYPLANGKLARPGGVLAAIAEKYRVTPAQIALAWLLQRSPIMLPIPGTSSVAHLDENVAAAAITLEPADVETLNGIGA